MAVFEWTSKVDGADYILAADVNKLAQGILDNQDKINNSVNTTTDQDIDGRKVFHQEITVPSIGGMNPDLTIDCGYSLNLTANSGDVNINANNGNGNVNINGNVMVNGNNIAGLFTAIQDLTTRVTELETVNQDLENIIALQQSYIGGVKA